ncbi:MAG: GGDEF domain-containing protein [Polyangiales bacterium]
MDQGPTSTGEHTGVIALESTVLTATLPEKNEQAQSACLVILFGAEIGRRISLSDREVVIGRATNADLQIDAESVSRTHAVLSRNARGFFLRDQGSTNGTFVNDQPIRERMLKDGDQIRIGRAMLKFLTSDNVEAQYHEEIYRLMTVDGLTQVYNRRYFQEALERELQRSRRYGHHFTLVLLDIDHFKQINDRYGHQAGDTVLRRLGTLVQHKVRTNDVVARIGGEEFALILPESTPAGGRALAEKLRRAVEQESFRHENEVVPVTISLGLAEFQPTMAGDNADLLVKRADQQLYAAKKSGRNRVAG